MPLLRSIVACSSLALALGCGGSESRADEPNVAARGDVSALAADTDTGRPAPSRRVLEVPRPTGPFVAGVRSSYVLDPTRIDSTTHEARAVPVWTYYPVDHDVRAPRAPYITPQVQAELESKLHWPAGALDVDTPVLDAPRGRATFRGVLLASGGWATPVAFNTALIAELVSHAYVVVAFDHPHDTAVVEHPSGQLIPGMELAGDAAFTERVLDTAVILEHLAALVPGLRNSTPLGMWGHSMGGATALEALRLHPRLRAAVDLDGTPRGGVVELGTSKPVGILSSNAFVSQGLEDTILATLIANLRGASAICNHYEIAHYGFSDFVWFNPRARRADPQLGTLLEQSFETDSDSVEEGREAIAAQRDFLLRFMNRYVGAR